MGELVEVGMFAKKQSADVQVSKLLWKSFISFITEPPTLGLRTTDRTYYMYTASPQFFRKLGFKTEATAQDRFKKTWSVFRMSVDDWKASYQKILKGNETDFNEISEMLDSLNESQVEAAPAGVTDSLPPESDIAAP